MNKPIINIINKSKQDLRIAVDKMDSVETVSIGVFVDTGSRNEDKKNNGISHFLEHMAFKGTKTRSAKQIAEQFESIGGRINAYTSRERTVYYVKILRKYSEFAVEFLADILQNSVFDINEVEKERGVILQELAMTNDTPDDIIFDYLQETAYPNQSIGRPIIGSASNIKKFTNNDFFDYIGQQYNYSNIVITASGAINIDELTNYSDKYFNQLGANKIKDPQAAIYQGGEFRKNKKLEQNNLLIGFSGLSYHHQDYYKIQVLAMILGGGMSSRLFQEVRENLGLAYSIYAFNYCHNDSGLFAIYSATSPDKTNQLVEAIIKEIKIICEKITDAEITKVINQFEASILMSKESTSSRMQKLGGDILCYNRYIDSNEIIDKIKNISKKELIELANNIFFGSKPTVAMIGNKSSLMEYSQIVSKLTI
jgi:predicted Zn-dependent peptidase